LSASAELLVLPVRRSKRGTCYGNVAGWLGGWVAWWLDVWLAVRHTPVLYQNG